jgi:hypothetical protein
MGEYAVINYSNPARPWVGVARGGLGGGVGVGGGGRGGGQGGGGTHSVKFFWGFWRFGSTNVDEFLKEKITFEKVCVV